MAGRHPGTARHIGGPWVSRPVGAGQRVLRGKWAWLLVHFLLVHFLLGVQKKMKIGCQQ